MRKRVVVLRKINGLWQDTGLGYDSGPLTLKGSGVSPEYKFSGLKKPLARTLGSLYRVA